MSSVSFMEPEGMLKGWNKKVRMTSAMINAWMITRMVSPMPPSLRFAPVVTLIASDPCDFFRARAVLTLGAARRNERHRKLRARARGAFGPPYQYVIRDRVGSIRAL